MRIYILFFIILFQASALIAQNAIQISGKIQEAQSKHAVPYATILINDRVVYAGEDGTFKAQIPEATQYRVVVEQIGFEPLIQILDQLPAESLAFSMHPRPVWVSEILVAGQRSPGFAQSTLLNDDAKLSSQPRDVGDLLNDMPGFAMIKRGGYALDPVFRSFKYEQLNVVYDGGVELTHACPNRMDPATTHVNPEEIRKIELIRGPFSVRYGPSMGATINIVTETPFQESADGFGGSLEGGYEFNGNGKSTRLTLNHQKGNYRFFAGGGLKDYGNYSNGDGKEIPASFKTYDYTLKGGLQAAPDHQIQLTWRQGFVRDVLHAGLMMDTDYDNTSMAVADYQWRPMGATVHEVTAKFYGSYVDHRMSNRLRPNFKSTESVSDVAATTFGGRVEATLLAGARHWWFAGADMRYMGRTGSRDRLQKVNLMTGEPLAKPLAFVDTIWPDASISQTGLFLESRRLLGSRWTLLTGVRTDFVFANAREAEADFDKLYANDLKNDTEINFSATASLAFQPTEQWNLQLALGRGVRTANMIERYINHFNVGRDPYEYVGNPKLKPEANNQIEWSVQREGELFEFGFQVFYSYLQDYITARVDSTLKRKFMPTQNPKVSRRFVNLDKAEQMGFEFHAGIQLLRGLNLSGNVAYTYAQNLDWNEPLPEVAPLEATLTLHYERKIWWAELRGRLVSEQTRVSQIFGEPATPGFETLDFRAGVEPLPGLTLGLGVLNLFDATYWEHLNRAYVNMPEQGILYEPGRNATVMLKYAF